MNHLTLKNFPYLRGEISFRVIKKTRTFCKNFNISTFMTCFRNKSWVNLHIQVVTTIAWSHERRIFLPFKFFLLREPALRKLISPAKPMSTKIILANTMAHNWCNRAFRTFLPMTLALVFREVVDFEGYRRWFHRLLSPWGCQLLLNQSPSCCRK